ncbi:MAG: hypothetical protein PUG73_09990 [Pseudomonadota bacterium]|nr:hypothetical protein [Pseudomonadota bacterium]
MQNLKSRLPAVFAVLFIIIASAFILFPSIKSSVKWLFSESGQYRVEYTAGTVGKMFFCPSGECAITGYAAVRSDAGGTAGAVQFAATDPGIGSGDSVRLYVAEGEPLAWTTAPYLLFAFISCIILALPVFLLWSRKRAIARALISVMLSLVATLVFCSMYASGSTVKELRLFSPFLSTVVTGTVDSEKRVVSSCGKDEECAKTYVYSVSFSDGTKVRSGALLRTDREMKPGEKAEFRYADSAPDVVFEGSRIWLFPPFVFVLFSFYGIIRLQRLSEEYSRKGAPKKS